jgi:hypothetical protein
VEAYKVNLRGFGSIEGELFPIDVDRYPEVEIDTGAGVIVVSLDPGRNNMVTIRGKIQSLVVIPEAGNVVRIGTTKSLK